MATKAELQRRLRALKAEGDRLYRQYLRSANPAERAQIEARLKQISDEMLRIRAEIEMIAAEELTPRLVTAMLGAKAASGAGAQAAKKAKKATPAQLKGLALKRMGERTEAIKEQAKATKYAATIGGVVGLIGAGAAIYHGTTELIGSGRTIQFAKMDRETAELIQRGMEKQRQLKEREMALSERWLQHKQLELAYRMTEAQRPRERRYYGTRARSARREYSGAREQWQNWLHAQDAARKRQLIAERAQWEVWTEQAKAAARDWLNAQQAARKAYLTNLEQQWEAYNTVLREMMEERRIAAKHLAEMQKLAAETQSRAYLTELAERLKAWRRTVEEAARMQRELATIKARYRAEMDLEKEKAVNAMMKAIRDERTQMRKAATELVKQLKELLKQGIDVRPLLEEAVDLLRRAKEKVEIKEVRIMR